MNLSIINIKGKETGKKASLNDAVFGVQPNDHAIYLDIKRLRASQHAGTHKAKTRAEVRGSTRKIKRQKGSGTARAGAITSPLFRGGGRVFGPVPRSYDISLNKKVKAIARRSALTYKARDNGIIVLEDFQFETIKTKNWVDILVSLEIKGQKVLLVLNEENRNLYLSIRNISENKVINASELNTYDILDAQKLLLVESSIKTIEEILAEKDDKDVDTSKKNTARPIVKKEGTKRARRKIDAKRRMEKINELHEVMESKEKKSKGDKKGSEAKGQKKGSESKGQKEDKGSESKGQKEDLGSDNKGQKEGKGSKGKDQKQDQGEAKEDTTPKDSQVKGKSKKKQPDDDAGINEPEKGGEDSGQEDKKED